MPCLFYAAPLGTTNGVKDYTMVPAFPEAETNCPTNTSETPEKMTLKLPGSQCLKGYWTYKNSAGAVLLSCVAAIPLEDLFEAAGDVNLTDSELKSSEYCTQLFLCADRLLNIVCCHLIKQIWYFFRFFKPSG